MPKASLGHLLGTHNKFFQWQPQSLVDGFEVTILCIINFNEGTIQLEGREGQAHQIAICKWVFPEI